MRVFAGSSVEDVVPSYPRPEQEMPSQDLAPRRSSIGHGDLWQSTEMGEKRKNEVHWSLVLVCMALMNFACLAAVQVSIIDAHVASPFQKRFDEKDSATEIYENAALFSVAPLQAFVRSRGRDGFHEVSASSAKPAASAPKDSEACVLRFARRLQASNGLKETKPALFRKVMDAAGLTNMTFVEELMAGWLVTPMQTAGFVNKTLTCLAANPMLEQFACRAEEAGLTWRAEDGEGFLDLVHEAIHVAIFLEEVTARAAGDYFFASKVFQYLFQTQHERVMAAFEQEYQGTRRDFAELKWQGVMRGLEDLLLQHHVQAPYTKGEGTRMMTWLRLNIAEAARMDLGNGRLANVAVALSLMADIDMPPSSSESGTVFPVGKAWADAYIAWNSAYVLSLGEVSLLAITKLFIPSVSCTSSSLNAEDFVVSRVFSLALMIATRSSRDCPGRVPANMVSISLMEEWGLSNMQTLPLPHPAEEDLEEMLYGLCLNACARHEYLLGRLSDEDFRTLMVYLAWITVLITGWGLEAVVGQHLLQVLSKDRAHDMWRLAQFLFPLLATVALNTAARRDWICLLPLLLANWKFGFPETASYLHQSRCRAKGLLKHFSSKELSELLAAWSNCCGLLLHHGAASLVIAGLAAGLYPLTREIQSCIMPLILQHWLCLLRYVHIRIYSFLELILEVAFEASVLLGSQATEWLC